MDTPPHRLGLERAVEVHSGHDGLAGVTGSGYVIGADLVLTCADVVDPAAPCRVRPPWSSHWAAAEPVWRGHGGVLLRVPESPWSAVPGIDQVRWARVATISGDTPAGDGAYRRSLVGEGGYQPRSPAGDGGSGDRLRSPAGDGGSDADQLPLPAGDGESGAYRLGSPAGDGASGVHRLRCVARGFAGSGRRRVAQTLSCLVASPTSAVSEVLTVSVLDSAPASLWEGGAGVWEGMAGAALLAEPAQQIIGLIAPGPVGHSLAAIPVTSLLGDERFRELTAFTPGRLETVAGGESSVILPDLLIPAREQPPQDCPDWRLLLPRHAVVPFLGRQEELAELREWAADATPLSVAVLTGRSGTGKTRLAGELCEELAEAGWDTGFLPLDAVCVPLSDPAATLDALRPTLLVVDHPEPSAPLVGELVRRLARHRHNPRTRLLLLAREPGEAEWWRRLDTAAGGWLRRLNTTTVHLNTRPLTLTERTLHA
ncbi:ATP-binding protein, partial [Nonomuraea sp. K274]